MGEIDGTQRKSETKQNCQTRKKCGDKCGNQVATRKDQYLNITDISRPDID